MLITCPCCGSESLRTSRSRSLSDTALSVLGLVAFRCLDCDHRFRASIWRARQVLYAKCPRCIRLDLSKWNTTHYNPPFTTSLAIACGAKCVRCEYCRHNFWSFRRVKVQFNLSLRAGRSPIVTPAPPRTLANSDGPAVEPQDHASVGSSPQLPFRSRR
jgi:hypothetical protein